MKKRIARLISILYRKNQVYLNHTLKEYELTSAEAPFLMHLYEHKGLTQEELSAYAIIDKGATARAIKSLEEKGYVVREKDEDDKRFNRVYLTEKAYAVEGIVKGELYSWSDFLTEGMEEDEKEKIYDALEGMVEKVKSMDLKREEEE